MAIKFHGATALTGGGSDALDALDGDELSDGDAAFVVTSNYVYIYVVDADSAAAEDSPEIIAPDTNAGDKRWIRVSVYGAIQSSPASGEYRIKNMRLESDKKIKVVYDGDAES